ncbi:hypothetical protein MED222_05290 [Vibrio sp. MED222]|nr:hypothetical protein MED222_05290 [Vibrio sp. MED222]
MCLLRLSLDVVSQTKYNRTMLY